MEHDITVGIATIMCVIVNDYLFTAAKQDCGYCYQ